MGKNKIRSRLSLAMTFLLAGILLFLSFRGVDWEEMLTTLRQLRAEYVALAFVASSVMFFLRGLRWRTLLSAEETVPHVTVFWATTVGYLANSFLPARAGEVIRSVMIGRSSNISNSFVLATALTERLLDAVALVLISLFAILFVTNVPEWLYTATGIAAVLGLAGMVMLVLAPRFEGLINWLIAHAPFPQSLRTKLIGFTGQFLLGMRAFQHTGRALRFVLFTVIIWLADAAGAIVVAWSLNIEITLPQMLIFLAALGLSSAAPSTPGFVGIYQFVSVTVLGAFGISQSEALAFIIVIQACNYLFVTVLGVAGLWQLNIGFGALQKYIVQRGR